MADKFEHQIADQVSGFQLTPSSQVWKGVEMELDKSKSKKRGVFWWFPIGIMGIGLAGIYWFAFNNQPSNPIIQGPKKSWQKELSIQANPEKDTPVSITHLGTTKEPFKNSGTDPLTIQHPTKRFEQMWNQQPNPTTGQEQAPTATEKRPIAMEEKTNNALLQQQQTTNFSNTEMAQAFHDTSRVTKQEDTIVPEKPFKKEMASSSQPMVPPTTKKPQQTAWKLQMAIGSTRLTETTLLGNSVAADRISFANNSSVVVAGFPTTTSIATSNKGFHAEFGISKSWHLSKRWELGAGLTYRYLQNQQMAGLKKDSSFLISSQASSNGKANTINSYYLAGNEYNLTNSAHWLMLPIQMHLNLNPSSNINWLFYGGTNFSWNMVSHWLLADQANQLLYEARPLTNLIGIHAQLGIEVRNQKRQSLSLGWEKSINSMNKLIQSKQYWNQLQLQYSQPLYFKKSSKQ